MTFSSLLRFITYSSGMWTKTVEEELSISSVSYEAIFFLCRHVKKRLRRRYHSSFFAGKIPKN